MSLRKLVDALKAELLPGREFPYEKLYYALFEADLKMGLPPGKTKEEMWERFIQKNGTLEEFIKHAKVKMEEKSFEKPDCLPESITKKRSIPESQLMIDGVEKLQQEDPPKRRRRE